MLSRSILWTLLLGPFVAGCTSFVSEEKDEKAQTIPLDKTFATFDQKGIERLTKADDRKILRFGLERLDWRYRSGASNVFLVRGDDIASAVSATQSMSGTGGKPGERSQEKSKELWLVAYLGTGPSKPAAWSVVSVERKGKVIRVSVKKEKSKGDDKHRYFLWAPLGVLPEGVYSLEFHDADAKEVKFMRRVIVPKY